MVTLNDIFIGDYRISQRFSVNRNSYIRYGLQGHDGVDWATPIGTKLISPMDGLIISVKNSGRVGYGLHVKIWSFSQRCCILMAHLKSVNVRFGQTVKSGQLIGLSGNTGNSTGPHLHLGLCLTNALGYRINTRNGFAGWIDPLSRANVRWVIKNPKNPIN